MSEYSYEKKLDILIIGAGVIGCSIAYFLAKESQGKLKIGVLERNTIGEESSSGAAGMLAVGAEFNPSHPLFTLALESRDMFEALAPELKQISGVDIQYVKHGICSIAYDQKEEDALRSRLEEQKLCSLGCEYIAPENLQQRFPFLNRRSLGGLWSPNDGHVSSSRLTLAFSQAAQKLGVQFFEMESFDAFKPGKGVLNCVETNLSKFSAHQYIFATGSWTGKLLGGQAPVEPVKGQILLFEIPKNWPYLNSWRAPIYLGTTPTPSPIGCYMVPKLDGHIWVGATMEHRGFDKSENKSATETLSRYAAEIFPELATFPFKGTWVGLRPGTPDQLPILGLLPETENVYVASGHFRNGILLAPITGKLFAELILKEEPLPPQFSPERWKTTAIG